MTEERSICQVDFQGFFVSHKLIAKGAGAPPGWFFIEPPENLTALNQLQGGVWIEVAERPPVPSPEVISEPVRIDKVRFKQELLTGDEQILFNKTKRQIDRLTDEDYDDPNKQLLVAAEVLLEYLTDAEAIELDHAKTIFGVGTLLVALGIVTPERAAHILQNKTPDQE